MLQSSAVHKRGVCVLLNARSRFRCVREIVHSRAAYRMPCIFERIGAVYSELGQTHGPAADAWEVEKAAQMSFADPQ